MQIASLQFEHTIDLTLQAECWLEGVSHDGIIMVQDVDDQQRWLRLDGTSLSPQTTVDFAIKPMMPSDHPLNWGIQRPESGCREHERTDNLVHPLAIHDKMVLCDRLGLSVPPPLLLGVGESRVLSLASWSSLTVICQRYQLVLAQPGSKNYTTLTQFVLRTYDPQEDPYAVSHWLNPLLATCQPLDCTFAAGHLVVLDGGERCDTVNKLHIWHVIDSEL
jgi:hypothetical protein